VGDMVAGGMVAGDRVAERDRAAERGRVAERDMVGGMVAGGTVAGDMDIDLHNHRSLFLSL